MKTRHLVGLALAAALLFPSLAMAKRLGPPKVEPVVHNGVRYMSPNNNGRRAYVEACDAQTGKKLWTVTVFENRIDPHLEEDVQHEYIAKLSITESKLSIETERGRKYSIDLTTRKVTELSKDKKSSGS